MWAGCFHNEVRDRSDRAASCEPNCELRVTLSRRSVTSELYPAPIAEKTASKSASTGRAAVQMWYSELCLRLCWDCLGSLSTEVPVDRCSGTEQAQRSPCLGIHVCLAVDRSRAFRAAAAPGFILWGLVHLSDISQYVVRAAECSGCVCVWCVQLSSVGVHFSAENLYVSCVDH